MLCNKRSSRFCESEEEPEENNPRFLVYGYTRTLRQSTQAMQRGLLVNYVSDQSSQETAR